MNFYKRKLTLIIALVFFMLFCVAGCDDPPPQTPPEVLNQFSVHYIDVGDGDCILIKSKNGKHMLIDTGSKTTYETVKEKLIELSVTTIDYLLLTNPTSEHVGAVEDLLNDFTVSFAYIPKILDLSLFTAFSKAKEVLETKNIPTEISYQNEYILLEDCHIAFLTPTVGVNGAYSQLNVEFSPDKYQIGNVSPIVYCEYSGVRFLFTGDAYQSQEDLVLNLYENGIYEQVFSYYELNITLENIDFLKVSAGGDDNATSREFLDLIKPKNAIISVSATNSSWPSSTGLSRLFGEHQNYGLYRTDVHGTISVEISENGEYTVNKQK